MMTVGENVRRLREQRQLSQDALAQAVGVSQSTIDRVERNVARNSRYLPRIAVVLGVQLQDLDPQYSLLPGAPAGMEHDIAPVSAARDLPVYASAEGGEGQIILSTEPVDFMPRPAPLAHVRSAYGLYLTGDSMIPEFWPGDIAMVNPKLPIINDVPAILYAKRDGEAKATIKRIRRATEDDWHLRQWNPPEGMKQDFTLDRDVWRLAHRVVGKYLRS